MWLILNLISTSLLVLVTLTIGTNPIIGTGQTKKMSSYIFLESETVQTLADTNQKIIKRIAELQKQINELYNGSPVIIRQLP